MVTHTLPPLRSSRACVVQVLATLQESLNATQTAQRRADANVAATTAQHHETLQRLQSVVDGTAAAQQRLVAAWDATAKTLEQRLAAMAAVARTSSGTSGGNGSGAVGHGGAGVFGPATATATAAKATAAARPMAIMQAQVAKRQQR